MASLVSIIDVTNRDGIQTGRPLLPKLSRTLLNIYLDGMGIRQSEIGFPSVSHESRYINANLRLADIGVISRMGLQGWCRALPDDVADALRNCPTLRHLHLSMPVSDTMIEAKFQGRQTVDSLVAALSQAVDEARRGGVTHISLGFEDASRAPLGRLEDLLQMSGAMGLSRFRYSDTLGLDDPLTIHRRLERLAAISPVPLEVHCHNDLGFAVASSIAAAQAVAGAGVDAYINTTVNGYGERAGNCDLTAVLLALTSAPGLRSLELDESVDLTRLWKIASYAAYATGIPIHLMQPGVGRNVFCHESGIHADAALKDHRTYEPFDPLSIGRGEPVLVETGRTISTGAYGGLKGFRHVCDRLSIAISDDAAARRILRLVQLAHLQTLKPLTEDELRLIAAHPDIVAMVLTVEP